MSTHEGKADKARALGLEIVSPHPNEIFLDLDDEAACAVFWENVQILGAVGTVMDFRVWPSNSRAPWRYHAVVWLTRDVRDANERILLQLLLGSDRLHEALSWRENFQGLDDVTVFFEAPGWADRGHPPAQPQLPVEIPLP